MVNIVNKRLRKPMRQSRIDNPEKQRKPKRQSRIDNPEKQRKPKRQSRIDNPEKQRKPKRQSRIDNPEKQKTEEAIKNRQSRENRRGNQEKLATYWVHKKQDKDKQNKKHNTKS